MLLYSLMFDDEHLCAPSCHAVKLFESLVFEDNQGIASGINDADVFRISFFETTSSVLLSILSRAILLSLASGHLQLLQCRGWQPAESNLKACANDNLHCKLCQRTVFQGKPCFQSGCSYLCINVFVLSGHNITRIAIMQGMRITLHRHMSHDGADHLT